MSMLFLLILACMKTPTPIDHTQTIEVESGLRAELVMNGSIESRLATPDQASLVVYYMGEQQGSIAPCGCPDRPRGGLPRAASYLSASTPGVILNTGEWLDEGQGIDGQPRADATLKNEWMVRGLAAFQADAIHVSFHDLFGLSTLDADSIDLPLVSANIHGPGIQPFIKIKKGNQRIGITGISHPGHPSIDTPGFQRHKPIDAAMPILRELDASVDTVLLFAHGAPEEAKKLARSGHVDVVIDTDSHRSFEPPFRVGEAVWVRSHAQGMRLGELRLGVHSEQAWALDRKIDLDDSLPDHSGLQQIEQEARVEMETLEKALFNR